LFMLVGRRLGLQISGCNYPGHFLTRAVADDAWGSPQELFFDPYDGGRVLTESEVNALHKAAPLAMSEPSSAIITVARVLRNLVVAYEQIGSLDKARFMLDLLGELESVAEGQ
jgi:regulator of sirC expression with transglutaminase-like and TPR domain